jgi:hypothetical protein
VVFTWTTPYPYILVILLMLHTGIQLEISRLQLQCMDDVLVKMKNK